eukprot:m.104334 g.104334  ORF g.104334 m.104334 type:complete len:669 (+) comp27562_c0_seq5:236-2242(+)
MNTVNPLLSPTNSSPHISTGGFVCKKMERNHVRDEQDGNISTQTSTTTAESTSNSTRGMDLSELLACRGAPFNERELWAVCRQAAIGISSQLESIQDFVPHEADVLIVSPKSMHFSSSGDVKLNIIQVTDDLEQYLAPELEVDDLKNTAETMYTKCCQPASLVFSLAATLFMAADYNLPDEEEPAITEEMELLLSSMTDEDVADRATLAETAELAADGLMVCEDNEDPELSRYIVANMVDAADSIRVSKTIKSTPQNASRALTHAVKGGPTLQSELLAQLASGVPLKKVPEATLRRPAEIVFTPRDIMLQGIRSPAPLSAVTERLLKPLANSHIARIAPPPTYVTPHEALLQDIAKAKLNLKTAKGRSSTSPSKPMSTGELLPTLKTISQQPHTPAMKARMLSPNGNKKILLTPTIDIMADWDPNKQVQLGFATESAKKDLKRQQRKPTSQPQHADAQSEPTRRRLVSLSVLPELDLIAQSSSRRASEMLSPPPSNNDNMDSPPSPSHISTADKWKRKRSSLRLSKRRSSSTSSTTSASTDAPPPSPPRTIDITDWGHIRASLVKAKLENLGDEQPELHAAIVANRSCGMCHVRFGIFKTVRLCVICKLGVCATCAPNFEWPAHLQIQLDAMRNPKTRTTSICSDCKLCLGGRSPTRPTKQITSPIVV